MVSGALIITGDVCVYFSNLTLGSDIVTGTVGIDGVKYSSIFIIFPLLWFCWYITFLSKTGIFKFFKVTPVSTTLLGSCFIWTGGCKYVAVSITGVDVVIVVFSIIWFDVGKGLGAFNLIGKGSTFSVVVVVITFFTSSFFIVAASFVWGICQLTKFNPELGPCSL